MKDEKRLERVARDLIGWSRIDERIGTPEDVELRYLNGRLKVENTRLSAEVARLKAALKDEE